MTTSDADLILKAIQDVRGDLAEVKTELSEVKAEAKATNGRLRRLELWRAGLDAVRSSQSWIRPAAVAFVTGAMVTILAWTLTLTQ